MSFHSINQSYTAFLNNPTIADLKDIGHFVVESTGKPFFTDVVLFAANIKGDDPNTPELFYNNAMTDILENNLSVVRSLQEKGVKVHLSYLGDHENAGWSANMSTTASYALADKMVTDITKFGLDGINIDDEYSQESGNVMSFFFVIDAIRNHTDFQDKQLTKALWADDQYFSGMINCAIFLTGGYSMAYNEKVSELDKYVNYGISRSSLSLGISPENTPYTMVMNLCSTVIDNAYGGVMFWAPNSFFNHQEAQEYYTEALKAKDGNDAKVIFANSAD